MTKQNTLKAIDVRMSRLAVACAIIATGANRQRLQLLSEELDQLTMVRQELAKLDHHLIINENSQLDTLQREMEIAARKITTTRFDDPRRHELLNEFTRIAMMADSLLTRETSALL